MAKVTFLYWSTTVESDEKLYPAICGQCSKCGHRVMAVGSIEEGVAQCTTLFQEECPLFEKNTYHTVAAYWF